MLIQRTRSSPAKTHLAASPRFARWSVKAKPASPTPLPRPRIQSPVSLRASLARQAPASRSGNDAIAGHEGGAAAAGAGGREARRDAGADAGQRGGLHRGHRRARPPLRLPRGRVARGLPRRRRRRLRHALLHAAPRKYAAPHSVPPRVLIRFRPLALCSAYFICGCSSFLECRLLSNLNRGMRPGHHCQ
jgi:hypothetical protein